MSTNPMANLDPAKVLQFVAVSSVLGKRACDELTTRAAAEKRAADLAPALIADMLKAGVIEERQKAAAAAALGDHAQTMHLLKNAVAQLAIKQASAAAGSDRLGSGVDDAEKTGTDGRARPAYDSLRSPFVGARTGQRKASDIAFANGLGIDLGG